jgi:hypothetical protein
MKSRFTTVRITKDKLVGFDVGAEIIKLNFQ